MILSGESIRERVGMIDPFCERTELHGFTYGLANASYDIRIGQDLIIPPGGFELASSIERFEMPNDLAGRVMDKSTWARKGLFVQNTFIDPGWCGWLTLELTNNNPFATVQLIEGMPIAQIVFEMLDRPTTPYDGKYQDQENHPVEARG